MTFQTPDRRPPRLFIPPLTTIVAAAPANLQHSLHSPNPNFQLPSLHIQKPSMQTPFTNAFQPPHPTTPSYRPRHRTNSSIAQFALTSPSPFQPSLSPFPQATVTPPFVRNRRTASISLGGPPKALLGGPQRKPSPLAGHDLSEQRGGGEPLQPYSQPLKKKIVVNLPDEQAPTLFEGRAYHSPPWARHPWPERSFPASAIEFSSVDVSTREIFVGEILDLEQSVQYQIILPSQVRSHGSLLRPLLM